MSKSRYVVTITRQFGSLGRPIAKRMSELLNIEYYDREIVDQAAKKLNLPESVVNEDEESAQTAAPSAASTGTPFYLRQMRFPLGKGTSARQDEIFAAQQNIIKFLADKETCIIVGRCSDFTLEERENAVHIFIYAPYEKRVENCVKQLHMDVDEARRMIVQVDEARRSYHLHYAGYAPNDELHKDIMIDSSLLGEEGTAEYLAELIRRKFPEAKKF